MDVNDCCNAALFVAEQGLVDKNRLVIDGRSAGGFTTLACLVFRNQVFAAGASHYGVADLRALAGEATNENAKKERKKIERNKGKKKTKMEKKRKKRKKRKDKAKRKAHTHSFSTFSISRLREYAQVREPVLGFVDTRCAGVPRSLARASPGQPGWRREK